LIDDDEVPELTEEDFKRSVPFSELPAELQFKLSEIQRGNVVIRPDPWPEEKIAVPISKSLVEKFQANGNGWESKVDAALREWLAEHQAS
jgi:uncharacterized protein (DUF4415 family)